MISQGFYLCKEHHRLFEKTRFELAIDDMKKKNDRLLEMFKSKLEQEEQEE